LGVSNYSELNPSVGLCSSGGTTVLTVGQPFPTIPN